MIEGLFKTLLVVILLVVIIPLVLLLFGEGALAYRIFGWAFSKDDKQELSFRGMMMHKTTLLSIIQFRTLKQRPPSSISLSTTTPMRTAKKA